ncbi:MAG: hypothetical protein HYT10_02630 [Candidatus Levybacteria bacterium]|nr:hypothetical protein [Candidatus Levybacteria bacterium]
MENEQNPLLHKFNKKKTTSAFFIFVIIAVFLGVGTGYMFSGNKTPLTSKGKVTKSGDVSSLEKGDVIGSDDTKTFTDTTEGKVAEGGIEGEGQFHLIRPGGESQYVYMTSSTVDLSKLIDRKVKVWGQTQKAEKAGWLMDVGRVEVLE